MFRGKSVSCCFGCVECSGENLSAVVLDVLDVQGKICQLLFWMCWIFRGKSVSCCFGCVGCSGENLSAVVLDVLDVQGKICQLLFWMCWIFRGKSVSCSFGCVGCSGGICQQFFSMISVSCWREALALLLQGRMELVFTPQSSMTVMSGK